jgi:hypothetical protein
MWCHVEPILLGFRPCFSRSATYFWFVIIVFGLIVRCDHQGTASLIRWLFLDPQWYDPILRFFRAKSWNLETVLARWAHMVTTRYPLVKFNGRPLIIGDSIKVAKEAYKMPGLKFLHQDSNNSGKSEYIFGHHFGFAGLLVGSPGKSFCVPLEGRLHEGIGAVRSRDGVDGINPTLVTRMAYLFVQKAMELGQCCYATADAFYAVGPMFLVLKAANKKYGEPLVHLITRAKDNTVAYLDWENVKRKYREKDKVKLWHIFDSPQLFETDELVARGEVKTIRYYCIDMLWKPIKDTLRFVLVLDGEDRFILMSSDLDLAATEIITIYLYRAKIETMFLFLKHLLGAFCYRFWTKALPKQRRKQGLETVIDSEKQRKLNQTLGAIERHVNLAAIALGLLQYLAISRADQIWKSYEGWLRTYSCDIPSEAVVQSVVRAEFFSTFGKVPVHRTLRLIHKRSRKPKLDLAA